MRKLAIPSLILVVVWVLVTRIEFEAAPTPAPVEAPKPLSRPVLETVVSGLRDVTPDKVLPVPLKGDEVLERLPGVVPPPPPPVPPKPIVWRSPRVLAAGLIASGPTTIRLDGIKPLDLDRQCDDQNGISWPCGMFARTELRQFIRGRAIECAPTDDGNTGDRELRTTCHLANQDIAGWIVRLGWAMPTGNKYRDDLAEAQSKKVGQWRDSAPGR